MQRLYDCLFCALAPALFCLLAGLGMWLADRWRRRRKRRPKVVPPTPSAEVTPRVRVVSVPDLAELAGAPTWGGVYDDGETQPDPVAHLDYVEPGPPIRPAHASEGTTRPYPLRVPSSMRPPAPDPWAPVPAGAKTTISQSADDLADEIEADAKKLRQSAGKPVKVPEEFRGRVPHRDDVLKGKK